MIRYHSHKQLPLAEFDWPFQTALDENNRWVKLSECIPWDELAEGYYQGLSKTQGRPTKDDSRLHFRRATNQADPLSIFSEKYYRFRIYYRSHPVSGS